MRNQRIRRAIVLAAAGVLLAAAAVFADTIRADGDTLTSNIDGLVDLGEVGPGAVLHVDVGFQLDCSGSKHVDADQTVTLTLASRTVPLGGNATATAGTISPPAGWPADGATCASAPLPGLASTVSHVTITAPPTAGTGYIYTLSYSRSLSPSRPATDSGTFSGSTAVTYQLDVVANAAPILTVPPNMTVEGNATGGATVSYPAATATDAEDNPDPTPSCSPASGSFFALGTTTVSCSVTDSGGKTDSGTFTIIVVDTTDPVLSGMPADQSLVTNDPAGATMTYALPSASDIVDPNASVSCSPASGSLAPVGTTTVTCTATDASGNSVSATFQVTVHLNAAPILTVPANVSVEGNATGGATVSYPAATAIDAEDNPDPTPSCSPASGSFYALGTTTVSCSVTDSGGKTVSDTFTITVVDTTDPVLSGVPANMTLVTNDPAGATMSYTMASASDVVDAHPSVSCSPASGSPAPVGTTIVTCTATDASGNSASGTFQVNVYRNTAPVLTVPANMSVEGNATGGARVSYPAATAIDDEDNPDPTPSCSPASGSFYALGTTTVSCSVADSGGLTDSRSFTIRVSDTVAPVLSGVPSGLNLTTTNPAGAPMTWTWPTASDVVDAHPSAGCNRPPSGWTAPVGDTTVTCTGTDASANVATARFNVHVSLLSADTWTTTWEEPIGGGQLATNGNRTIPVKLRLYRNGVEVVTGSAALRIVPCGATAPVVEIPLAWSGRWTGKIDTSSLIGNCFRVTAVVGDAEAGSFQLDLNGATPVKTPGKSPTKTPKP